MKTSIEKIKQALESKNVKYEINSEEIGIKLKQTYYWFSIYENTICIFRRSYNQNNGNTCKGLMHGIKSRWRIEKKLGLEF